MKVICPHCADELHSDVVLNGGQRVECGPGWFSGMAFGKGLEAARDFFAAFYGLFGALAKIVIGLAICILDFALSLFA